MPCPDWRRALAVALAAGFPLACAAGHDALRAEIVARLQSQAPLASPADLASGAAAYDPELRAAIAENAGDARAVLAEGQKLWSRKFKNGRSLAGCFPNGGRRVAVAYPQFDTRLKRVVTLEMAVNQCLKTHNEPLLDPTDPATMGVLMAHVRSLSEKQKIAVRVPAAAEGRFDEGRRIYFTRMGQRNFACASCHVQGAGKRYDDQVLSAAIGQAASWPAIRDGKAVTLQARMRECLERMGVAPYAAGSDELNHIEYFLTSLATGLVLQPNAWRPR